MLSGSQARTECLALFWLARETRQVPSLVGRMPASLHGGPGLNTHLLAGAGPMGIDDIQEPGSLLPTWQISLEFLI